MIDEKTNHSKCNTIFTSSNNDSFKIPSDIFSIDFIGYPFNFRDMDEEKINETDIYFLKDKLIQKNISPYKNIIKFFIHKKRTGRQNSINLSNKKKRKIHNKYDIDNIMRKCQVSYFNFIIDLMNIICQKFGYYEPFVKLNYNIKKIVNKEQIEMLRSSTIEEVIGKEISPKNSTKDKNYNKIICEQIRKLGKNDIINILNLNFFFFFDNIYFKSLRNFNLKELNISNKDITIELPKEIELYEDLKERNNDIKYKEIMDSTIKNKYYRNNMKLIFKISVKRNRSKKIK